MDGLGAEKQLRDRPSRRQVLRGSSLALAGLALPSCAGPSTDTADATFSDVKPVQTSATTADGQESHRVLLAYFSRAGENYYYGGRTELEIGNTEVMAAMIADLIGCDIYRIDPVTPYPHSYDQTRELNIVEQQVDARPPIAGDLPDLSGYDQVLLGSPVWNVRAPMIMHTFIESVDLSGKIVLPFVTHAVSGLGRVEDDYRRSLPRNTVRPGLAVQGESVADAGNQISSWLRETDLLA